MNSLSVTEINDIYNLPLLQLLDQARLVHKQNFADEIELCKLISIKTGGCPEDCAYCSQSNSNKSEIKPHPLLPLFDIETASKEAKLQGIKRICIGAAYKKPTTSSVKKICEYIKIIKDHGLETCATLGSLDEKQVSQLKDAGLDYYNHNIDTSPEYYPKIITTRTFNERVDTINLVGNAGIKVCCGGILGMGESQKDRIGFIKALFDLPYTPTSIPINMLVKIPGTRLENVPILNKIELIRVIATVRIIFTTSKIRLSAGRNKLSDLEQSMCFYAGANSIWAGDKLLTVPNTIQSIDEQLFSSTGLKINV